MLQRTAENYLNAWHQKSRRKPLVIRGARQVGKSTLVRRFAQNNNLTLNEINLEQHLYLDKIFKSLDMDVITKELEIPLELLEVSAAGKTPLLRSSDISSVSIAKMANYLERRLAPRMTIHGVLIQIFGLGVLILGPSGIGKSECALELILKGHRLITDDYVELTKRGIDRLAGAGGKTLKHHIELRGLGIINIKELFGISATGAAQNVDFAVRLERWNPEAEYDRLGLDQSFIEYLGVSIPVIDMPVAPGRNIATLVEVAARLHLLRRKRE